MNDCVLKIDVYSDAICPWCYVGKRRVERALEQLRGTVTAQITWRPFQLNPTMPKEGVDRADYLKAKFGGLDVFRKMEAHLLSAGESEQIPFAFGKIVRTPNTFLAHRLIWCAQRDGQQDNLVERLFRFYFVEGRDLGDVGTLVQAAVQSGLDRGKTEAFLSSDEGVEDVKAEEAKGHALGIRAVPYFVFNEAYGISGAQPVDMYISAFEQIQARGTAGDRA